MKWVVLLVLFCAPVLGQVPSGTPAADASAAKRRVSVVVAVTDRSGSPVQSLAKNQLLVSDNGDTGEVQDVRSLNQLPLHLAIVLHSSKTNFGQQQAAAVELVKRVLRPNVDKAFVIVAAGDKPWTNSRIEWQTQPDALEKFIRGLDKSTGIPDAFTYELSNFGAGQTRMDIQKWGGSGTNAFTVVWMMMKTDPRPARRAVVMFRDAQAHSPGASNVYSKMVDEQHAAIIAEAQQLWASFYMIGVDEPATAPVELGRVYSPNDTGVGGALRVYDQEMDKFRDRMHSGGRSNVERMAQETGGGCWWSTKKNYADAVVAIGNQLNSLYALTYATSNTAAVAEHVLKVKPADSGLRVAAQRVYFSRQITAEQPASAQETKPPTKPSLAR